MLVAFLLVIGALGFLLIACFIHLRYEMGGSAAAMVMAGAMTLLSFIIILAVGTVRWNRKRASLGANTAAQDHLPDSAFNDIAEWLESSGFSDEAKAMRATLVLSRQARPYSLVAVSFLFGILSSTRLGRSSKRGSTQ